MKTRLYRIINIKMSESVQVFDLLPVQFFIGLGNALVNIVAFTLFIYNFKITVLPEVYMVVAAMLLLMNLVYEKLEHALKPLQLLKLVIALSATLIFVLWIGLAKGDRNTFIYIFMVASILLYMLTGYAFWGLVSLLFNVRESRRVFSIVGAGDIPAKLIGYLAVPLLIPYVGIYNVLWFAVGSFGFALYLFHRYSSKGVWEKVRQHNVHHVQSEVLGKRDMISFLFGHKLIFAISLISIISYNVFILIDYTFISQVKAKFHNEADLAAYVAIFFAVGRMIALIFKIIFTSRVIEKFGIVQCLFITPIALVLFSMGVFLYGHNNNYTIYIFGVMAMLTEVLRSTIQEPVFFILFQPLKEQLRLKGHIISKGYMYPPSLIIVGLTLWFLHRTGHDITILQAVNIVLANLLVWGGIIFFIGRIYLQTVHASIKKGIFSGSEVHVFDQQTIKILLEKTGTGKTIETIYALDLLEKGNYSGIIILLEEQLRSVNEDVQKYALGRLDEKGEINTRLLRELLPSASAFNYPVIVNLLCKHDADFLDLMSNDLSSHDHISRKNIIIHLLEKREFRHLLKAGTEIHNLIESSDTAEKELAIDIISEMKHLKFDDVLLKMLSAEHTVKRKAILAVCKLNLRSLLPVIFRMLDTPDRYIVLKGLLLYGDQLFEHINGLEIRIEDYADELIKTAGQLKGIHSKNYLLSSMRTNNLKTDKVLESLWDRNYQPETAEEKSLLTGILTKHNEESLMKVNDYALIQETQYQKVISTSVFNEIQEQMIISLKICSFLYHTKEINRVIELLIGENHSKIYNAMEMLDLVLPKKVAKDINQLFEFILDPEGMEKVKEAKDLFITKVIYKDSLQYSSWTKAICIYSCWKNNDWHLLTKLGSLPVTETSSNVLKETSEYVLQAMNPLDYADNRKNIITQEL